MVVTGFVLSTIIAFAGDPEKESVAISAVTKWLAMIDSAKYEESWKEAAELFRNAVQLQQWEQSMQAVCDSLGKLVSRKVKAKAYKTSLPGAPDGRYVVIQFETSFQNKKTACATNLRTATVRFRPEADPACRRASII
jgi:hypothetical protein